MTISKGKNLACSKDTANVGCIRIWIFFGTRARSHNTPEMRASHVRNTHRLTWHSVPFLYPLRLFNLLAFQHLVPPGASLHHTTCSLVHRWVQLVSYPRSTNETLRQRQFQPASDGQDEMLSRDACCRTMCGICLQHMCACKIYI